MRRVPWAQTLAGLLLAFSAVSSFADATRDGLAAAKAGRYEEARQLWLSAGQNADALNNLGVLYEKGQGVPRDLTQAAS